MTVRLRVSRRRALKFGLGLAAASVAAGPAEALAASADALRTGMQDGVGQVAATAQDTLCPGKIRATLEMAQGKIVTAELTGFPAGFTLRVGDLVAVDTRTSQVLCSAAGIPSLVATVPTAYPLARWTIDTPRLSRGALTIGAFRLVPSARLMDAAHRQARLAVCTLESTLSDRQILATRPA